MPDQDPPVDEYGIPIKRKVSSQAEVDEYGIVVKKKEQSSWANGGLLSKNGGQVGTSEAQSVDTELPSTGQSALSGITSKIGVLKSAPKSKKIQSENVITDYNKSFRDITGTKSNAFTLGSDLPQIKKAREQKEYVSNRNIFETEIKPVQSGVATGTVSPQELKTLYEKPYGKKVVADIVRSELPELEINDFEPNAMRPNEDKFGEIAQQLQAKNRQQGVDAQNQSEFNLDNELSTTLSSSTYGADRIGVRGGGESFSERKQDNFGDINTSSASELSDALRKINSSTKVWDAEGKEVDKKILSEKIKNRIFQLKAGEDIHPEIAQESEMIARLVDAMPVEYKRQGGAANNERDAEYVMSGLNYIRDTKPGEYKAIMSTMKVTGKMPETTYTELANIGRDVRFYKDFKSGDYVEQDDRSFLTPQLKKANLAGWLSEDLARKGFRNRSAFTQKEILESYQNAPEELKDDELVADIIKAERAPSLGFIPIPQGEGLAKKGVLNSAMIGAATPIGDILNSVEVGFNSSYKSPFDAYLKSKELDRGNQTIINKKGDFSKTLDENFWNKGVEGFFNLMTQAAIARGIGNAAKMPLNAAIGRVDPRAAITSNQAALSMGTPLSTMAQTFGSEYMDFLEKTGSPTKATLGALASGLVQGQIERFVMPDVKLVDDLNLLTARKNFAKEIINVVDNGGGRKGVADVVKDYVGNVTKIIGKEAWLEEGAQNFTNYLTEQIISPKTAQDRDLLKETVDTGLAATAQMGLFSLLGAAGQTKMQQGLGKAQLNSIAANPEQFIDALGNQLAKGEISQPDYELATQIINKHRENNLNAPKTDANGELISAERQLEYAYQSTVADIAQQQANKISDKIQREPLDKKIAEADKIKRQIFYGEENKDLPSKEGEPIAIAPELKERESELDNAAAIAKTANIQGYTADIIKDAAENDPQQFEGFLSEIAQQAYDERSAQLTEETYGKELVDAAKKLFPQEPSPATLDFDYESGEPVVSNVSDNVKNAEYEDISKAFDIKEKEAGDEFWTPTEKPAKDVMDWIGSSEFSLPHEKELINEYKKVLDPNLKIVFDTEMPMNRGGGAVFKNGKLVRIDINPKVTTLKGSTSNFTQTVLHEITHALTYGEDGTINKDLVNELSPLFDAADKYINENIFDLKKTFNEHKITYGLSGINEFIAEAMSNRDFQKVLSSIPYKNTSKTVWQKLVDGIKKYFSDLLGTKNETVLNEVVNIVTQDISKNKSQPKEESVSVPEERSDADIEKRMAEIEGSKTDAKEFNDLEKEMESRERATVFGTPLDKVGEAVDALMQKEKDKPNGFGSFIDKKDATETKEVAEKYSKASGLTEQEIKRDFNEALFGNPDTWYADGLKLRESMKEAANRGVDIKEMVAEVEKEFIKDGFTSEDAKAMIARKLAPIYKDSQKTTVDETTPVTKKPVNLQDDGKEAQNIGTKEGQSAPSSTQLPSKESTEALGKRYKRVTNDNDFIEPYDRAVKYFADGGGINPSELERIFGGKGDKGARISLMKNNAGTVKQIAHYLWETDTSGKHEDTDYIDAIEEALRNSPSKSAMQKDLVDRYDWEAAQQKYQEQKYGNEAIAIVEKLSDEDIDYLLQLAADENNQTELETYIDELLANETANQQQPNKKDKQSNKSTEEAKPTDEAANKGSQPPIPPTEEGAVAEEESPKLKDKGVLTHLYKAKNVPEAAKKGFEQEGLQYKTSSQKEAELVAKALIDEVGIDEAISLAEKQTFDGDVNSLIFAVSLDRLYEQAEAETNPIKKNELGRKLGEIGITYDKMGRIGGKFNSAINFFYKKSPLGIVMMENAKRKDEFNKWAKQNNKSWEEFFEELKKVPEFEKIYKENINADLKKERAEAREKRKEKVQAAFKKAKDQFKGGAAYSTIIPPKVIVAAIDIMEKAYLAGEAVAKVIQQGIDYISTEIKTSAWDTDKFKKEWEAVLKEGGGKKPLTDEELKTKVLDKFRKKLNGLTDKQKDEVIRKAHRKLIENGALDFDDFKEIIGRVTGRAELSPEDIAKIKDLVKKTNAVEEAAVKVRTERTEESFVQFTKAEIEAGRAARDLNDLFHSSPDIIKRLTSIMQLSTLGIPALINNPIYNFWNQLLLRFPIGLTNDLIDRGISGAAKLAGKNYDREYNVLETQGEFWSKIGLGTREAMQQIGTGLNRQDYISKEVFTQIRPFKSFRDLQAYAQGKKPLSKKDFWDKVIQATAGVPAEIVARLLNVGDKPQRFGAEGAQAAAFSKALGLKGIDHKIFAQFPREEAYRHYKAEGLSDEVAGQKADYVRDAIIKEGQRSTFQQDNMLNDALTRAFGVLGGKDSGTAQLTKSLAISPYIKIPSNAFWSLYNLVNPEIAMLQAGVHAANAQRQKKKGEITKSKLQNREARYWMAHAIVGVALRGTILMLVKAGVFTPSPDDDESKKERDANAFYEKPGTMKVGDVQVSNRWFGVLGAMGNIISKQQKDMTPEQKENSRTFWNIAFGGMEMEALEELENGIFANSSSLLQSLGTGDWSRYGVNTLNLFANIIQPAAVAQINRAALDEVPSSKGDTFLQKLNNNFAQRSTLYRWATNTELKPKRDIWGEPIPKGGTTVSRLFGISKGNPQLFGRPVYEDALRTNDTGFLPPAVLPTLNGEKLNTEQHDRLTRYIGQERKKIVQPYVNDMAIIPITNKKYSELDDEGKKKALGFLYTSGRDAGLEKFYTDYPQFRPKAKTTQDVIDDALWDASKELMKSKF